MHTMFCKRKKSNYVTVNNDQKNIHEAFNLDYLGKGDLKGAKL